MKRRSSIAPALSLVASRDWMVIAVGVVVILIGIGRGNNHITILMKQPQTM